MSKITRQDGVTEQYGVMQDWLVLFAHELEKKGYLENLKPISRRKHFHSIEEKMADIKERIGFDVVSKLTEELEDISKEAQTKTACGCGGSCCEVKTANYEHPERDVKRMRNILSYINDMAKSESHLSATAILSKCRDAEGLGFNSLRIDEGKLKGYVDDLLSKYSDDLDEDIRYEKREIEPVSSNTGLDQADYYSHARPDSF
jgi:hypothetical protein